MVFIQKLVERTRYRNPLSEVAEQITNYQTTAFLPQVKSKKDDKEGGNLERAVKEIRETSDGRFVIDGLVAGHFKPHFYDSDIIPSYYSSTNSEEESYSDAGDIRRKSVDEHGTFRYERKREIIQHEALEKMGLGGSGKYFTPEERERRKIEKLSSASHFWTIFDYARAFW